MLDERNDALMLRGSEADFRNWETVFAISRAMRNREGNCFGQSQSNSKDRG